MVRSQPSSSSSGCLVALGSLLLITFIFVTAVGIAINNSAGAAGVFVVIALLSWFLIARAVRRARDANQAARRAAWEAQRRAQMEAEAAQQEALRQQRWAQIVTRYGEADARRIWIGRPWVGCSATMLVEMLGRPDDIDTKVLKTKTKETYKYRHQGGNRYGLRISLDDGQVVGWDEKD